MGWYPQLIHTFQCLKPGVYNLFAMPAVLLLFICSTAANEYFSLNLKSVLALDHWYSIRGARHHSRGVQEASVLMTENLFCDSSSTYEKKLLLRQWRWAVQCR